MVPDSDTSIEMGISLGCGETIGSPRSDARPRLLAFTLWLS